MKVRCLIVPKFIPSTVVVIPPKEAVDVTRQLGDIATEILHQYDRGVAGTREAFEARLEIGKLLVEARSLFASDTLFGQWVTAQEFGWTPGWTRVLMQGSRLEPYMREAVLATTVASGEAVPTPGFKKTIEMAKELAVADGAWTAPAPKYEPEGEDDLQEPTAQLVLQAMFEDLVLSNFLRLEDSDWLEVTHGQRLVASELFKRVATRMLEVHALWKAEA
jgi:hypothetical protein